MGKSTEIWFRCRNGVTPDDVDGDIVTPDEVHLGDPEPDDEMPSGSTWGRVVFEDTTLSSAYFYGESYERGLWPHIAMLLMQLLQHPGVEAVWYDNDGRMPDEIVQTPPFTVDDLNRITSHFVAVGTYRLPSRIG